MPNRKYAGAVQRVYASTMPAESIPYLTIAGIYKAGIDYMIDFSVSRASFNEAEISASMKRMTGGTLQLVEDSIYPLDAAKTAFRAALKSMAKSVPYNEDAVKGMSVVSANVFKDDADDSIWKVVGDGEAARLVQMSAKDQGEILRQAYSAQKKIAVASMLENTQAPGQGDVVMYYNVDKAEVRAGVVADVSVKDTYEGDGYTVLDNETKDPVVISGTQILSSAEMDIPASDIFKGEVTAGNALSQYIDYLRKLYPGQVNQITELTKKMRSYRAR